MPDQGATSHKIPGSCLGCFSQTGHRDNEAHRDKERSDLPCMSRSSGVLTRFNGVSFSLCHAVVKKPEFDLHRTTLCLDRRGKLAHTPVQLPPSPLRFSRNAFWLTPVKFLRIESTSVAVTQARNILPEKPLNDGRTVDSGARLQRNGDPDEPQLLSTLRELVAAGEHRLDPMLAAIADGALLLTGATGVAIAMWKDGAMVCRARSGETAPPLGAQLSADKGISGECLRTGKVQHCVDTEKNRLVDVEVCRTLGLRSIAVLPIQGWRGVNGILEAFSTEPAAFNPHHLGVLEQLAGLAERARAAKPVGASPTVIVQTLPVVAPVEKPGAGWPSASLRSVR